MFHYNYTKREIVESCIIGAFSCAFAVAGAVQLHKELKKTCPPKDKKETVLCVSKYWFTVLGCGACFVTALCVPVSELQANLNLER